MCHTLVDCQANLLSRRSGGSSMTFHTVARRAILGCGIALAAAGSTAHPVMADSPSDDTGLPSGLVEAVRRDLGIGASEYLERVETGTRLAEFAQSVGAAAPAAFAGVRM